MASSKKASPAVKGSLGSVRASGRSEKREPRASRALTSSGEQYLDDPALKSCLKCSLLNEARVGYSQQK